MKTTQRPALLLLMLVLLSVLATAEAQTARDTAAASFAPYNRIEEDYSPAWSPDGKQIVYTTQSGFGFTEGGELKLVSSTGGTPKTFFKDSYSYRQPAWSPDGKQIAFSSNRGGQFQIWIMSAQGTDLRQLTSMEGADNQQPVWSPDGKQIAFVSQPGYRIMIVPAAGGEPKLFTIGQSPAWSPDGKQLAYSAYSPLSNTLTVVAKPLEGGGAETRLSKSTTTMTVRQFRQAVDWSPDGKRILCTKLVEGASQVAVVNVADDTVESTTTSDGSLWTPRWSPDGKRILYTYSNTGHPASIRISTPDEKERTEVTRRKDYTTAQLIRYKSADGLEIPAYLFLPRQSKAGKGPAILWLHGDVPGMFGNRFYPHVHYFVDQGFTVLAVNYRTSGGYNPQLAKLSTGDKLVADISAGVDYLKSAQGVEASRIGIVGFSFGGWLMLSTLIQNPDLFAAAVDFYGPSNMADWYRDVASFRPLMALAFGGTPEQKPDVYRMASPVNFVERIKTPLLILHGTSDTWVPYSQSVALAEALKAAKKEHEFITYQGDNHGLEKNMADAFQNAMRYLSARLRKVA
ncbi:MAG TPA: LpqB family beta-propeller domain-containing protein [Pyrinomonadaceae bacterium]|nr:LpqB family beta-propeller domain-containing protein [Pyrinomonadaceae bacterium]